MTTPAGSTDTDAITRGEVSTKPDVTVQIHYVGCANPVTLQLPREETEQLRTIVEMVPATRPTSITVHDADDWEYIINTEMIAMVATQSPLRDWRLLADTSIGHLNELGVGEDWPSYRVAAPCTVEGFRSQIKGAGARPPVWMRIAARELKAQGIAARIVEAPATEPPPAG